MGLGSVKSMCRKKKFFIHSTWSNAAILGSGLESTGTQTTGSVWDKLWAASAKHK